MLVTVYEVAGDGTLSKKLILNEVVDYHYKEWFYKIGNFELTVLASDPGLPYKVYPGDILYVYDEEGGDDSLYVTTVSVEKGRIKFEGYDLKILLNFRTTLFPTEALEAGTYGYDVRQGYTGDIIKGYIDYNLCEAEDPNRQIPNCYCTTDSSLGISDDTYMSRLQPLNEVVEDLCKNAGIGYKVTLDTYSNYIIINIFGGRDKHAGIGFGTYIGNADSVKKIRDNSSQRSDVWAVNGTNADDSTVTNVQLNNSTESGIRRKETVITLNCETELVEEFAKHSSVDFKETDEIDASVSVTGFENKVGDYVVVYDDIGGYNKMRINAIEKEYSGEKLRKKLHFVDYQTPTPKEKTLEKLSSETNTNQKDIIDQKLDGGGGGGTYYAGQGLSLTGDNVFMLGVANQADLGGIRIAGMENVSADDPSAEYGIFKKTNDGFPALRTALSYQKGGFFLGDGFVPELEEEEKYGEIYYSPNGYVRLRIGEGLEFVDNDEAATNPKELKENSTGGRKVSVKVDGQTVKLNDNGQLSAEGYAEGAAIAFRTANEQKSINVKYDDVTIKLNGGDLAVNIDNDTIQVNDDGKLASTGVTIENGIIIQEADAQYLLHEYKEVEYIQGNRIGYAGAQNQIIVQGLIVYKQGGTAPNGVTITGGGSRETDESLLPDMPLYTDFSFTSPTHRNNGNYEVSRVLLRLVSSATTHNNYQQVYVKDDGTEVTITSFNNYDGYTYGWFLLWTNIYPPGYVDSYGITYPFGCATCAMLRKYKSSATQYYLDNSNSGTNALNIGFASEAEYNAAVGLTYEPLTLTEVQETTTEV